MGSGAAGPPGSSRAPAHDARRTHREPHNTTPVGSWCMNFLVTDLECMGNEPKEHKRNNINTRKHKLLEIPKLDADFEAQVPYKGLQHLPELHPACSP